MIISLRRVSRFLRMLVFVLLFSFITYKVLSIVHVMIQPIQRYREPSGNDAVKVGADLMQQHESSWQEMLDRLASFYQNGE